MNKFLAKCFTLTFAVAISGCAVTPIAPTTPRVAPVAPATEEPRQATRLVSVPRPTQPVEIPQVKKITTITTHDCLLDAAGNRTTDCMVVPNGTTKARDSVRGTKEEGFTPPALSSDGKGPFVFEGKDSCLSALRTGSYRYYEPKFLGARNKHPVDGVRRKVAPFEWDRCVHMHVVGGKKWVVQKTGTIFRYNVRADGKLEDVPYEHDACGNEIYGVADLPPEKKIVPGDWIRRYGIFKDEVVVEEVVPQPEPRPPVVRRVVAPLRCCIPRPRCISCCPPGYGGNGYGNGASYQSYQGQESYRGSWSTEYYNRRR